MRLLFAYRWGVVGGVCAQLHGRLRYLATLPGVEAEVLLGQDLGAAALLARHARVHVAGDPAGRAALLADRRFDAALVIDTPEMIAEAAAGPVPLLVEVHTTMDAGLGYLATHATAPRGFITPSESSRRLIHARFGVPLARITAVPNVVDGALFGPGPAPRPPRPVLSWVGKLDQHKRWGDFLEVGALLGPEAPDLWMFGGETAPDEVVDTLHEAAAAGDLLRRLTWFPRIDHEAMPRAHRAVAASDGVTVVTSKDESFGMSVAEALLSGCPAVVPEVGALPELAPGAPYLRVYPPRDLDAAAAHVRALLGPEGADARAQLAADRDGLARRWAPERAVPALLAAVAHHLGR